MFALVSNFKNDKKNYVCTLNVYSTCHIVCTLFDVYVFAIYVHNTWRHYKQLIPGHTINLPSRKVGMILSWRSWSLFMVVAKIDFLLILIHLKKKTQMSIRQKLKSFDTKFAEHLKKWGDHIKERACE